MEKVKVGIGLEGSRMVVIKDGKEFAREISNDELMLEIEKENVYSTGILPQYCRWLSISGTNVGLVLHRPAAMRTVLVKYEGSPTETLVQNVPLPAALMFVRVIKTGETYQHADSRYVALRSDQVLNEDMTEKLYHYPFSNLHFGSEKCCWGDVKMGTMKSLNALGGILQAFERGGHNQHWNFPSPTFPGPKDINDIKEFFKYIAAQGEFKDEWLQPTLNYTFKTLLHEVFPWVKK